MSDVSLPQQFPQTLSVRVRDVLKQDIQLYRKIVEDLRPGISG